MTTRFSEKIALITGAGSGIGRESALAFAREGAIVVAAGRNLERVEGTVRMLREAGGTGEAVTLDVSDHDEVAAAIASVMERHGHLDIAHNNAGDLGDYVVQTFQVLDVQRRKHVDARRQQGFNVLPSLGVNQRLVIPYGVRVCQFIDND